MQYEEYMIWLLDIVGFEPKVVCDQIVTDIVAILFAQMFGMVVVYP